MRKKQIQKEQEKAQAVFPLKVFFSEWRSLL